MKLIVTEYGPWSEWRDSKEPKCSPYVSVFSEWMRGSWLGISTTTLWRSREVRTFVCGFARTSVTEYQSVEAKDGPTALKGLNGEPKTFAYKSKKPKTRSRV